jgi:hypothetical protein
VATTIAVLHQNSGQLAWLPAVLLVLGAAATIALLVLRSGRARAIVLAAALGLLLLAPASWAVQTLGHATNGTFPAGGPALAGMGAPGAGGRGGPAGAPNGTAPRGQPGAAPSGAATGGPGTAPGGQLGAAPSGAAAGLPGTAPRGQPGFRGGPAGGLGGDSAGLTQALHYVSRHGGGTIAVASQSGAAATIISSDARVAGIGGFSGRESEVSATWLADAVRSGRVRWVLAAGNGFGAGNDGRVGSSKVMAAVAKVGRRVSISTGGASSTTTVTLYDLSGRADALAAAS